MNLDVACKIFGYISNAFQLFNRVKNLLARIAKSYVANPLPLEYYILHMVESKRSSRSRVLHRFRGKCFLMTMQKTKQIEPQIVLIYQTYLKYDTDLNWQKMSAYSAAMPVACKTVTRNVNSLPINKCSPAASSTTSCSSDDTLESPRPESASSTSNSYFTKNTHI